MNPNNHNIEECNNLIKLNPNDYKAYFRRAQAKKNKSDKRGAITDYTIGLEFKPDHEFALHNRGIIKMSMNDYRGAIVDFDKAIEIFP